MAVTVTPYGLYMQSLWEGRINTLSDELWCMLVTSGYVFNQHTHKFKSVVSGEIAGSGYVAGGQKVTTSVSTYDSTTKTLKLPAGNIVWPSVSFTGAIGAVLYFKPVGVTVESAMPLYAFINFGESISRATQAFYLNWPTTGIMRATVP